MLPRTCVGLLLLMLFGTATEGVPSTPAETPPAPTRVVSHRRLPIAAMLPPLSSEAAEATLARDWMMNRQYFDATSALARPSAPRSTSSAPVKGHKGSSTLLRLHQNRVAEVSGEGKGEWQVKKLINGQHRLDIEIYKTNTPSIVNRINKFFTYRKEASQGGDVSVPQRGDTEVRMYSIPIRRGRYIPSVVTFGKTDEVGGVGRGTMSTAKAVLGMPIGHRVIGTFTLKPVTLPPIVTRGN